MIISSQFSFQERYTFSVLKEKNANIFLSNKLPGCTIFVISIAKLEIHQYWKTNQLEKIKHILRKHNLGLFKNIFFLEKQDRTIICFVSFHKISMIKYILVD